LLRLRTVVKPCKSRLFNSQLTHSHVQLRSVCLQIAESGKKPLTSRGLQGLEIIVNAADYGR